MLTLTPTQIAEITGAHALDYLPWLEARGFELRETSPTHLTWGRHDARVTCSDFQWTASILDGGIWVSMREGGGRRKGDSPEEAFSLVYQPSERRGLAAGQCITHPIAFDIVVSEPDRRFLSSIGFMRVIDDRVIQWISMIHPGITINYHVGSEPKYAWQVEVENPNGAKFSRSAASVTAAVSAGVRNLRAMLLKLEALDTAIEATTR